MQSQQQIATPLASSIRTVADRLDISRAGVYGLLSTGKLRSFKLGSRTLVAEAELQRFIASLSGGDA
ncbi:helix-turn-helix domain-containing protein [Pseudoxanthomonas sp. LARHCG66]